MSSDDRAGDWDDPGHARLILLPTAGTFDGRDRVMSAAAYELHVSATRNSAAGGQLRTRLFTATWLGPARTMS